MSTRTEPITDTERDEFKREELDDLARAEGIENPESYRTKADVVAAINERIAARAGGGSSSGTTTGANAGAPSGPNPPRDEPATGAAALNTTAQVTAANPTAASVFGGDVPLGSTLAYDTSAFQPKGDAPPIYGDARTRTLVDPNGKRHDTGKPVAAADDNRDKGNE